MQLQFIQALVDNLKSVFPEQQERSWPGVWTPPASARWTNVIGPINLIEFFGGIHTTFIIKFTGELTVLLNDVV
jgi:hypothetical protein